VCASSGLSPDGQAVHGRGPSHSPVLERAVPQRQGQVRLFLEEVRHLHQSRFARGPAEQQRPAQDGDHQPAQVPAQHRGARGPHQLTGMARLCKLKEKNKRIKVKYIVK
jgi:hypothetical protein